MKMKKTCIGFSVAALLCSFAIFGCDDSSNSTSNDPVIEEKCNLVDYPKCDDENNKLTCVGGRVFKDSCGTDVCSDGECKPPVVACDPEVDKPTCEGNVAVTCTDAKEIKRDDCYASHCVDGACVDAKECKPECEGHTVCNTLKGECEPKPKECEPAEHTVSCELNARVLCVEGYYEREACEETENCTPQGCEPKVKECDPACAEDQICVDGECKNNQCTGTEVSCDTENNIVSCDNGTIVKTPCNNEERCDAGVCKPRLGIKEKAIGAPCTCKDDGQNLCAQLGAPIPAGGTKIGCDNVPEVTGGELVCLRTNTKSVSPLTYFTNGYCSRSAASCTGGLMCDQVKYGDYDAMTSCPKNHVMLTGTLVHKIMLSDHTISNKTCAPMCDTDADCRLVDEVKCVERLDTAEKMVKFCYDDRNFDVYTQGFTVQSF